MGFKYHNKKRNAALLYEFLIRHISKNLIASNKSEANRAVVLSKKYFSKGSVLSEELKLFKSLLDTQVTSRESAHKILNEVVKSSSKLNARNLDIEKSKLIKEINYTLKSKDFYDHKIPDYLIYASIHSLLGESRNKKKVLSSIDRIKLEDKISEYLIRENKFEPTNQFKTDPRYNNAVYKFVIERFNEKYENKLTESQKKLLTKYSVYTMSGNEGVIKSAIQKEVAGIKDKLRDIKDKSLSENKELSHSLKECYKKVVTTDFDVISENNVLKLLQFMQLVDEVEQ